MTHDAVIAALDAMMAHGGCAALLLENGDPGAREELAALSERGGELLAALRAPAAHAARDAAEQSSHEDTARYMQHMARADAASREARELRAQLTTALRERDEARAEAAKLKEDIFDADMDRWYHDR